MNFSTIQAQYIDLFQRRYFLLHNGKQLLPTGKDRFQALSMTGRVVFSFLLLQSDHTLGALAQIVAQLPVPVFQIECGHIIQRLLPVRGHGSQLFIQRRRDAGAHRALDAVQRHGRAKFHTPHIQAMGNIMLHAGGRPGKAGIIHGHAGDHQAFKYRPYRAFLPLQQTISLADTLCQSGAHQFRDFRAVIFPGEQMGATFCIFFLTIDLLIFIWKCLYQYSETKF